jgi:hypothetical protein
MGFSLRRATSKVVSQNVVFEGGNGRYREASCVADIVTSGLGGCIAKCDVGSIADSLIFG